MRAVRAAETSVDTGDTGCFLLATLYFTYTLTNNDSFLVRIWPSRANKVVPVSNSVRILPLMNRRIVATQVDFCKYLNLNS